MTATLPAQTSRSRLPAPASTHGAGRDGRQASAQEQDAWYRAIVSRDPRFDGWILVGVTSTGIYCRPSCPTPVRPKRANVTFHRTAAAAQRAGFRACKRCRPDAVPGSPAWDVRGDLVGRAMRLIADGVVDREGVTGLASRLVVSERQLHRVLTEDVGAGPLAIARAGRAQTARILIETTELPFGEVAFAAGFRSIRQHNDTIREVFASTPTRMRAMARRSRQRGAPATPATTAPAAPAAPADVTVRLAVRAPFDGAGLLGWFDARAVAGVERIDGDTYTRSLHLPGGPAVIVVTTRSDHVLASFLLSSVADLGTAVARVRRILDLDADPGVVADALHPDPVLRQLLADNPGVRVPGAASGMEAALLTVVGQQVSVAAAARTCGILTERHACPLAPAMAAASGLTHAPLAPGDLAGLEPGELPMPRPRAAALIEVARLLAAGDLDLDPGADRDTARSRLLAIPGIGPWTADYLRLRGLGDPDVLMDTDLIVRRKATALGLPSDLATWARPWAPWRSYVSHHLWASRPKEAP